MKVRGSSLVGLAATLVLASCGQPSGTTVDEVSKSAVVSLMGMEPEIGAAINGLAGECAKKHGWSEDISQDYGRPVSVTGLPGLFRTSEEAQKVGYASMLRNTDETSAQMTESQRLAIYGTSEQAEGEAKTVSVTAGDGTVISAPSTGCFAEAQKQIFGSVEEWIVVSNFQNQILQAGRTGDDAYRKVMDEAGPVYEKCMSEAGYSLAFGEAGRWAKENISDRREAKEAPTGRELELARVDGTCQEKAQLAEKFENAFFQTASTWVKDNEKEILRVAEKKKAALDKAKAILNSR